MTLPPGNLMSGVDAGTALLFILPGAVMLAGLLLVMRGLRGRRVGEHPHCRRCGFDLFGLPPSQANCPECGACLLARPAKAVAIGRRERRVRGLLAGLTLLAPAVVVLSAAGAAAFKGADANRWKPAWWLVLDLGSANPKVFDPAAAELSARLNRDELPDAQTNRAVDRILRTQADPRRPWSVALGDFVEDARRARLVGREAWHRYVDQAVVGSLSVNPVVRRDARFAVRMVFAPPRCGSSLDAHLQWERMVFTMGDNLIEHTSHSMPELHGFSIYDDPNGGRTEEHFVHEEEWRELTNGLPEGPHALRLSVDLTIADGTLNEVLGQFAARRTLEWSGTVTVAPESHKTIRLVTDPAVKAALKKSITANFATRADWMREPFFLRVLVDKPPVALAGRVVLQARDKEWPGQEFLAAGEGKQSGFGIWPDALKNYKPAELRVVYRPDPRVTADLIEVEEIWGEELELVPFGSELGSKEPW